MIYLLQVMEIHVYFVNFSKVSKLFPKFKFKYEVRDGVNEIIDNFESVIMNKTNSKRIKRINELIDSKKINTNLFWTAYNVKLIKMRCLVSMLKQKIGSTILPPAKGFVKI